MATLRKLRLVAVAVIRRQLGWLLRGAGRLAPHHRYRLGRSMYVLLIGHIKPCLGHGRNGTCAGDVVAGVARLRNFGAVLHDSLDLVPVYRPNAVPSDMIPSHWEDDILSQGRCTTLIRAPAETDR